MSKTITGMGKYVHSLSGGRGLYNSTQILSNASIHPHLRYVKYVRGKTERLKRSSGRTGKARWSEQEKETEHES